MGLPTLGTHRLPVQTSGDLQGRLPKRRAAGGEGRGVAWMVQPVSPHHARLGHRDMEEPPLQKVGHGQGHPLGRGGRRVGLLLPCAIGEGDAVTVIRHQAGVLDRTAPQVARQIRHHTSAMAIALHDPHMPLRLRRVAQAVQEVEPLLRAHRRGQSQRPARQGLPDGRHHLAPKHGHDHPGGQQKPVADGYPRARWGSPTPRDEAVHVRVQDQRLTPGVQRREDARLCPKILGVRQQGTQGVADRLQQGPKPTLKP